MNRLRRIWQFVLDSYRELRFNVTWPSRREVGGTTSVVLVMVAAMAIFLFVVDGFLKTSIEKVVWYFSGLE